MLHIKSSDKQGSTWQVGQELCFDFPPEDIFEIYATEDELAYILDRFDNIPKIKNSVSEVQYWYGDHAKFIIANLLN